MLCHDDRPTLRGKAATRRQHRRRAFRIELRSGLVQGHEPRPEDQDRRQLHTLPFAAGERGQPPPAQPFDPERDHRSVHSIVHLRPRHAQVLQAESDLPFDRAVYRLRLDVLEDEPDALGQARNGRSEGVQTRHLRPTRNAPAVELRHQAVEEPQERGLATARVPDQQREAGLDAEIDLAQRRLAPVGIPVRNSG